MVAVLPEVLIVVEQQVFVPAGITGTPAPAPANILQVEDQVVQVPVQDVLMSQHQVVPADGILIPLPALAVRVHPAVQEDQLRRLPVAVGHQADRARQVIIGWIIVGVCLIVQQTVVHQAVADQLLRRPVLLPQVLLLLHHHRQVSLLLLHLHHQVNLLLLRLRRLRSDYLPLAMIP